MAPPTPSAAAATAPVRRHGGGAAPAAHRRLLAACCLLLGRAEVGLAAEYRWIVKEDVAAPDGYPRSIIAVMDHRFLQTTSHNGDPYDDRTIYSEAQQIPGPEIRARRGERVIVHIVNQLPSTEISVHWHGIHMKDQAWMDGTAGVTGCAIAANGGTGTYNFTVDQEPGTHWWHSHVATQYADGLFGAFIIEPPEAEKDPVQELTPYTDDQVLTLQDWLHETAYDISARYMTRTGAFTQTVGNETLPFLPDYPWPSSYVLLNGRGQTDCKMRLWKDCEKIREFGWANYFNATDVPAHMAHQIHGLPTGTLGQCMPERPPLMGECNPDARAASLHCSAGGATRFRLINTGFSMPLRFWIDRHAFTVVARDGLPVVPTGPHHALVIGVGQRIDIVVKCNQDASWRYKVFAMVALREFYPGAYNTNFEAHSFAMLTYGGGKAYVDRFQKDVPIWRPSWCRRCEKTPVKEPEVSPKDFTEAGMTQGCTVGCNFRRRIYSSWKIRPQEYVPFAMEARARPLPARQRNQAVGGRTAAAPSPAPAAAPAAQERLLISVAGKGNWWNNVSDAASHFGLKFEWWNVNRGAQWLDNRAPLSAPSEPIMIGSLFGRDLADLYGTTDERLMPYIQRLKYNKSQPITYEVVFLNWEGQQHPWHTHGYSLDIVGQGWLDPQVEWRGRHFNASHFDPTTAFAHLPRLDRPAPILARVDTFTSAPHSFVVFRITADNPGAWMMHCHMDYHLEAGMGMLWSVEQEGGGYPLPAPPDDFRVCSREATYAAAKARHVDSAAALRLASAEERLRDLESELDLARRDKDVYLYLLVGLVVGLGAFALAGLLAGPGMFRLRSSPWHTSAPEVSGYPRVLGSPTASYVTVSD